MSKVKNLVWLGKRKKVNFRHARVAERVARTSQHWKCSPRVAWRSSTQGLHVDEIVVREGIGREENSVRREFQSGKRKASQGRPKTRSALL